METESYGIKICTVEGSFVLITVHHSTILVKQAGLWCTHTFHHVLSIFSHMPQLSGPCENHLLLNGCLLTPQ